MSSQSDSVLAPGTRLAHYEVRREIGSGAMGTVYECWDTALDRPVAVKVLRDRIAHEPSVVDRFFREARAAARVNHPNLTHIYFVGRQDDRPFFAMEYVGGDTLEKLVADRGAIPLAEAVEILVQAAHGLDAAHAAGVVHRDVKPSNLIRRADGVLKVADFGLAKSMDADVNATGGGSLMGTPTFMAPEQCRGREVDRRCDVYALGLVAWFILGGRAPYQAKSLGELLNDQINTPIPSVVAVRPELPPAVDAILAKLCAKDPAERPASMTEVAALFESVRPRRLARAALFPRGAAHAVDGAVALGASAIAALGMWGLASLLDRVWMAGWVGRILAPTVVACGASAAALAVLVLPEIWYQSSVGKYLFDLRVCRADGSKPGPLSTTGRLLLRFPVFVLLPFSALGSIENVVVAAAAILQVLASVAGVICYVSKDGLTLSDVVTKSRVAYRELR